MMTPYKCSECKRPVFVQNIWVERGDNDSLIAMHTIHDPDPQGCGPVVTTETAPKFSPVSQGLFNGLCRKP